MDKNKAISEKLNRKNEKGAALVTVLMVSLILLVASAGLLLESAVNAANVTDAVSEQQAYVAAESGLQQAIDVLRGNVVPSTLLDSSVSGSNPKNLISFRRALKLSSSNLPGDTATVPRLSRWLGYNSTYPDRVTLASGYAPRTGYAYNIGLSDPDNTGNIVSFSTSGTVGTAGGNSQTFGTGANTTTLTFTPKASTTLDVSDETENTDLGTITISATGTGYTFTDDVRFQIALSMTDPADAVRNIRGYFAVQRTSGGAVIPTTVTPTSIGGLKIFFNSSAFELQGSITTLGVAGGAISSAPAGYSVTPTLGGNTISCTMTPAEPTRVIITSTGYGPRGSRKVLEAIVQKNFFNGLTAPAALTMVGTTTDFAFNPGNSNNVTYSGDDVSSSVIIPSIGTTNDPNLSWVRAQFGLSGEGWKANVIGNPANVSSELPFWLWTPATLDATMNSLRNVAKASGNYYESGTGPSGAPGSFATGKGITFIDGDYSFGGGDSGGGILICTGTLTLRGKFSFKGMIIVTGAGGVNRSGGGNGTLQGNVVVAPYNPSNLAAGFLSPKYDISGGGTSDITFDSNSVANGMTAVSNFVLGVAEK